MGKIWNLKEYKNKIALRDEFGNSMTYDVLNHGHWTCKIICNETGDVFNSIREASRAYGISTACINNVVLGKLPYARGLTFSLIERQYLRN